ncbi:hypothetical protein ACF3MZ_26090 [Paenibacillaceae bacterium WGS1546]|uniref:hypothetical protein n=1 Tax=Cohnella sp. WGS1546 TaxID=3366810 RepID=UPI00372CF04C
MSPDHLKQQLRSIPVPSGIRQRSLAGIEQVISEQKEGKRRKSKRVKRRWGTIIAALAILFVSATLANHHSVWAAIQKALQFVPGIGIVKEENSPAERYVLKKPITLSVGNGSITITGILSDEEMTYITMTGYRTPRLEQVTLINERGVEYSLSSSMASWGSQEWSSGFWYKGKMDTIGNVKLIVGSKPGIEVPVTLTKAETYSSYPEMGETVTVNGVSITVIPDRVGEKTRVSLVARHSEDFYISDYGISGVYVHGDENRKLNISDDTGQKMEIEQIRGVSSPASEFYFKLSDDARNRYTLTLPEISVTNKDEASIRLSTEADEDIHQTFEIAGFPVTITKTEKVRENILRAYLDLHYNEEAPMSLYKFSLDRRSSAAKLNEKTGAIEYIEFEVPPGSQQVKLKLIRPEVIIRGPWQFDLMEEYFKTDN